MKGKDSRKRKDETKEKIDEETQRFLLPALLRFFFPLSFAPFPDTTETDFFEVCYPKFPHDLTHVYDHHHHRHDLHWQIHDDMLLCWELSQWHQLLLLRIHCHQIRSRLRCHCVLRKRGIQLKGCCEQRKYDVSRGGKEGRQRNK